MNLLYFRGGPRNGELLEFRNDPPPSWIISESNAMYTVNPLGKNCLAADFEFLLFPEATIPVKEKS
jgi:hypothetical protein